MDHEFKAGDVVQLRSGGPNMTIERIGKERVSSSTDAARCVWFEGEGAKRKQVAAYFEFVTLRLADNDEPAIGRVAGRRSQ